MKPVTSFSFHDPNVLKKIYDELNFTIRKIAMNYITQFKKKMAIISDYSIF